MKFNKTYIDNYFANIDDYHSMVELLSIAYAEFRERSSVPEWYVELSEIMNWQAYSDRSGVWTYYEVLNKYSAATVIKSLEAKEEHEILSMYSLGINKFSDETIMEHIDNWIWKNEEKIYKCLTDIFLSNKDWFYSI